MPIPFQRLADMELNFRRLLLVTLLYLLPAFQALLPVEDPDLWWHLRTGQWIIEHGQVPFQDPFSVYGAGKPWIAYSWLYEILVYGLFRAFGLVGIVWFTVVMSLLIALAIHQLIRRAAFPFLVEVILVAICLASLKPSLSPRPWLFSILFLALELWLLFGIRRGWKPWVLFLLPPLFLFWTNLHIQFVYGLVVMALFVLDRVITQHWLRQTPQDQSRTFSNTLLAVVAALCILATFANPYRHLIYQPVFEYATQTGAFENIAELHPMFFRSLRDWFVLFLLGAAAFSLGWRRRWNIFPIAVLLASAFFAFRSRRDTWFLVIVAAAVIAEWEIAFPSRDRIRFTRGMIVTIVLGCLAALCGLSIFRDISERALEKTVESQFPVGAAKFTRARGYQGPLYNHLDWGGYLIWALPDVPVAMDGRTNLHGDERLKRSLRTWEGAQGWDTDPELSGARLIIAEQRRPLTALLRKDSRFTLVYEDETAVVFIALVNQSTS
jgi:hypothetical protein